MCATPGGRCVVLHSDTTVRVLELREEQLGQEQRLWKRMLGGKQG